MNHKRGRVKSRRAGCLYCKPHKHQRVKGSVSPEIMGARNFRLTQDPIEQLAGEDSNAQIAYELNALLCDDPFCDCRSGLLNYEQASFFDRSFDADAYEEARLEAVTGETTQKLAEQNITVTWAT